MNQKTSSSRPLASLRVPLGFLLLLPIAPILSHFALAPPIWVFAAGAAAVAVLADWIRRATDHLATHVGPAIGGLLNVSLGSLAELILAFFVLRAGHVEVVRAQITGSIIGTGLFGLGVAIVVGAIGREPMRFDRGKAGPLASLLILVVIALLLPALFDFTARRSGATIRLAAANEALSIGVSIVMLLVYAANLVYTLVSRRDVFASSESRDTEDADRWPLWVAILVLVGATGVIAFESELVSGALESTAKAVSLSSVFIGVVVLALVGTISDLFAAAWFARQGKPALVINLCVGLVDPGRTRGGALARDRVLVARQTDDPGLRQSPRPVRHRRHGLHSQRDLVRWRAHLVRRRAAYRGVCAALSRILLFVARINLRMARPYLPRRRLPALMLRRRFSTQGGFDVSHLVAYTFHLGTHRQELRQREKSILRCLMVSLNGKYATNAVGK